jgi:hypothetical protein
MSIAPLGTSVGTPLMNTMITSGTLFPPNPIIPTKLIKIKLKYQSIIINTKYYIRP